MLYTAVAAVVYLSIDVLQLNLNVMHKKKEKKTILKTMKSLKRF